MNDPMRTLVLAFLVLLAKPVSSAAAGGPATPNEPDVWDHAGDHEWSIGVSQENRALAKTLFQEGRQRLHESLMLEAADKFRESLEVWDHPGTHYNLALALVTLDRPLELREHLIAATRYGPWPIKQFRFDHAKNYQALLESQLVRLRIRCDVPGARVTLDGEELFKPPGEAERWAKAGHHVVAATKDGFIANQVTRDFPAGARPDLELKLSTQEELTVRRRRWSQAVPWSVAGAGAAIALAGGGLYYAGHKAASTADHAMGEQCSKGCTTAPSGDALKRLQSQRLQKLAIGALAVGGATLLSAGVLGYLNRAKTSIRSYEPDVSLRPQRGARAVERVVRRRRKDGCS